MTNRVLLVEDEPAICILLAEALSDEGYDVTDALTCEEANAALAQHGAEFAVLVTDVNVGERGWGFAFARAARLGCPAVEVIYITGDSEHAMQQEAVNGAVVLPKPFLPRELVSAVAAALARRDPSRGSAGG